MKMPIPVERYRWVGSAFYSLKWRSLRRLAIIAWTVFAAGRESRVALTLVEHRESATLFTRLW